MTVTTPNQPLPVPARSRAVHTGVAVAAGETWRFEAEGAWKDWFVECGPDGYENPIADLLEIHPRAPADRWFCLVGMVGDDPGTMFRIGASAEHRFSQGGELVVFANDRLDAYWNNAGEVSLTATPLAADAALAAPGQFAGPAPRPHGLLGRLARFWRGCEETLGKTHGIGFIAVLVLLTGWVLSGTPPGQDLLTTVAENAYRPGPAWNAWLCATIALFSVQAWFWARMVVIANYGDDRNRWIPRWPLTWGPRALGIAPFAFVLATLVFVRTFPGAAIAPLALVGLGFVTFVIWREDLRQALARRAPNRLTIALRDHPGVFRRYWIVASYLVAVAAWAVFTLWPVAPAQALGPAATVFLALAGIIPITVSLIHVGRLIHLPLMSGLLVFAAASTFLSFPWADNHRVGFRPFEPTPAGPVAGKTDLGKVYASWDAQAPSLGGSRPIIFVASEGGASRAGYWTAEVLGRLQDETAGQFSKSVYAITSVSGGSVGAAGFVAALGQAPPQGYRAALRGFAGADFLSPTLAGMLFPDLTQRFLPIAALPDRAETLERSWEQAWRANCDKTSAARCADRNQLSDPFLSLWRNDGVWRPALIIEGASEETGQRILTSNLSIPPASDPTAFTDSDDFHSIAGRDVRLSTAILNGARYPWISPAGTLTDARGSEHGHIVDGGYFDASGAETTREIARAVLQGPARTSPPTAIFLLVGNCAAGPSVPGAPPREPPPTTKHFLDDLLEPFAGLYTSRTGHQNHLTASLDAEISGWPSAAGCPQAITVGKFEGVTAYYVPVKLCPLDDGQRGGPYEVPLDWALSERAQNAMQSAASTSKDCLAARNISWLVNYLRTGRADPPPTFKAGS